MIDVLAGSKEVMEIYCWFLLIDFSCLAAGKNWKKN